MALAVGASLNGEGHGDQGNGERGDANHFEDLGLCKERERERCLGVFNGGK